MFNIKTTVIIITTTILATSAYFYTPTFLEIISGVFSIDESTRVRQETLQEANKLVDLMKETFTALKSEVTSDRIYSLINTAEIAINKIKSLENHNVPEELLNSCNDKLIMLKEMADKKFNVPLQRLNNVGTSTDVSGIQDLLILNSYYKVSPVGLPSYNDAVNHVNTLFPTGQYEEITSSVTAMKSLIGDIDTYLSPSEFPDRLQNFAQVSFYKFKSMAIRNNISTNEVLSDDNSILISHPWNKNYMKILIQVPYDSPTYVKTYKLCIIDLKS